VFKIIINTRIFFVKHNISILEACSYVGIKIPRFCYHEQLSVAGNCRMCLVEIKGILKPVASCATPIVSEIELVTDSPFVLKARESVLEFLLLNHPLDCPICDQGGECDLQDQYYLYGAKRSREYEHKRSVEDKNVGPLIQTIMTRCIHCTRCVRFGVEICGITFLGTFNRGVNTEIGNYTSKMLMSELSGNIIDLCPVGALTSKINAFNNRPWELQAIETLDLTSSSGISLYVYINKAEIVRILPKKNKELNSMWIPDKVRFCFDALKCFRLNPTKYEYSGKISTNLLYNKNKAVFLITSDVDFIVLKLLTHLVYISGNQILINSMTTQNFDTNFYNWGFHTTVKELNNQKPQVCLLFSCNIRSEAFLLNTRIRSYFFSKGLKIFSFSNFFKGTFPITFCHINITDFFLILKNKIYFFSKIFQLSNLVFVLGNSISTRIRQVNFWQNYLKQRMPFALIFTIKLFSNSESLNFFKILSVNSNILKKKPQLVSFEIEDTIQSRKVLNMYGFKFFLGTSFSTSKVYWAAYTFSLLTLYETGGLFLNFEKMPKLANPLPSSEANTSLSLFSLVLGISEVYNSKNSFSDESNIAFQSFLSYAKFNFDPLFSEQTFSSKSINIWYNQKVFFSKYPQKFVIEDFYRTNTFTKNSKVLLEASRHYRFFN
jgi:hypothetical protein